MPAALDIPTWSYSDPHWECTTDAAGMCSGTFPGDVGAVVGLVRQGHLVTDAWLPLQALKTGEPRILLTTDKPLYQPGQVIHMRAMALATPGNKPLDKAEAEFLVVDSKGNKLARITDKTNTYGIASGQFKLGSHLNLGPYTVVAEVSGAQAAKTVKVSRYTLPKFKIETSLKKNFYLAGQTIEGAVHAYYLFGKPVAGGTVEIASFAADGETPGPFSVTGKTDEDGYFDFSAALPANIDKYMDGGDGLVYLVVKVIDAADQDQETTVPVPLTTAPIRVFLVPEGEPLVKGSSTSSTSSPPTRPARWQRPPMWSPSTARTRLTWKPIQRGLLSSPANWNPLRPRSRCHRTTASTRLRPRSNSR